MRSKPLPVPAPLGMPAALLYFAVPAALAALGFYGLLPLLQGLGWAEFPAYLVSMGLPLAMMLAAALWFYAREGNPWTWSAFKTRMRLGPMQLREWRFLLAVLGWTVGSNVLIGVLLNLGQVYTRLPLPARLPTIQDPRLVPDTAMMHAAWGGDIRGQWGLVLVVFLWLVIFNILGEELWWRGILLPRQEQAHGKHAWWVQGLLWTLFHAFKYWAMPGLLPGCLAMPFMAQRLKNNTPVLIAHLLLNSTILIPLIAAVLGR